jgi:hypothetical protein
MKGQKRKAVKALTLKFGLPVMPLPSFGRMVEHVMDYFLST